MTLQTPRERTLNEIGLIALRHGFTREDVLGKSRNRSLTHVRRHVARHFRDKGKSLCEIGRIMGRDHSTVIYYLDHDTQGVPGASAGLL